MVIDKVKRVLRIWFERNINVVAWSCTCLKVGGFPWERKSAYLHIKNTTVIFICLFGNCLETKIQVSITVKKRTHFKEYLYNFVCIWGYACVGSHSADGPSGSLKAAVFFWLCSPPWGISCYLITHETSIHAFNALWG